MSHYLVALAAVTNITLLESRRCSLVALQLLSEALAASTDDRYFCSSLASWLWLHASQSKPSLISPEATYERFMFSRRFVATQRSPPSLRCQRS